MHDRAYRLLIVQPYVPRYRVEFFSGLVSRLADKGIQCRVSAANVSGKQASRLDSATAPWIIPTAGRNFEFHGKVLARYGSGPARRGADAVIVGLMGSSPDTYCAIIQGLLGGRKVGLWGHVKSYVNEANALDQALEHWQCRHVDHIFAYTQGGATQASTYGIHPDRITTVMNSLDTDRLLAAKSRLTTRDKKAFQRHHSIDPRNCATFIGGLDESKRISFLCEALDEAWKIDPHFKILIGGAGDQEVLLNKARARGQAVMLGPVAVAQKALMGASSGAVAMPGRIGLVAVESLALGLPVVTTDFRYHAPESEYLKEGTSRFTSTQDPRTYAKLLVDTTQSNSTEGNQSWSFPTLSAMIKNFEAGVLKLIA